MSEETSFEGSKEEFHENWVSRKESYYNHWTPTRPVNQVQLAFRSHWEVFSEIMDRSEPGSSLEVGCGRGSLSCHFAANGWDVTLLDYSPAVIDIAKQIFWTNELEGEFFTGDANSLPFEDDRFDMVFSIGLLEHFEDSTKALNEQWRVLRPGGWLFAYIVPHRPQNVQKYFRWVNRVLKVFIGFLAPQKGAPEKQDVYRNDYGSEAYLPIVRAFEPEEIVVSGMYSMPMISHSPEFPFSLLPAPLERVLVRIFAAAVSVRRKLTGRHGWLCSESMGQAFLIGTRKPDDENR